MPGFTFQGASGNTYDLYLFDPNNRRTILYQGGIYVFARSQAGGPGVLYVGSAHSLRAALWGTQGWDIAVRDHGANCLYARPEPDRQVRRSARDDLVEAYQPPMNAIYKEDERQE